MNVRNNVLFESNYYYNFEQKYATHSSLTVQKTEANMTSKDCI
jgi:hypothetical protein